MLSERLPPYLGKDFLASIVVFLVALPLCMGIAIASGVPPALGLITGIVGGLVVGLIAGSPLQVSGPAAGLTVLVWEIIQQHGIGMLGVIVLIAGAVQMAAGVMKLGGWFRAVSPAVIHGMLAGIGVLIIASQFHVMVDDFPKGSGMTNLLSIPEAIWKGFVPFSGTSHNLAAFVGLMTILVMVGWSYAPSWLKRVPAPLAAVVIATALAWGLQLPINYVSVPENLLSVVQWPTWEGLLRALEGPVLLAGVSIALIASAETLLCATAVDQLHSGPRTNYDRELFAQGVGNTLCGLLGALPMTGVIVRSSANVTAGAQTRLSAILHGLWLGAFVVALPFVLNKIPTAALAAMLVFTGFKLISPKAFAALRPYGKSELAIYGVTILAIVATNLLEGVLIGVGLALLKLLLTFAQLDVRLEADGDSQLTLRLRGAATFLRLPKLAATLDGLRPGKEVRVDCRDLTYIDHACLDLILNWEQQFQRTGGVAHIEWEALNAKYHRRSHAPHAAGPQSTAQASLNV